MHRSWGYFGALESCSGLSAGMQLYGRQYTRLSKDTMSVHSCPETSSRKHHGFPNSCDDNAVREDSALADSQNVQSLLLLTAEGTKLSFRKRNTCFQFHVFAVLGCDQRRCCYCCEKPAAGLDLRCQGKEAPSGRDGGREGWGCCGCQDVS